MPPLILFSEQAMGGREVHGQISVLESSFWLWFGEWVGETWHVDIGGCCSVLWAMEGPGEAEVGRGVREGEDPSSEGRELPT